MNMRDHPQLCRPALEAWSFVNALVCWLLHCSSRLLLFFGQGAPCNEYTVF